MPRSKEIWGTEFGNYVPNDYALEPELEYLPCLKNVLIPVSDGDLGGEAQNEITSGITVSGRSKTILKKADKEGTIPCVWLDQKMIKTKRDTVWNDKPYNDCESPTYPESGC